MLSGSPPNQMLNGYARLFQQLVFEKVGVVERLIHSGFVAKRGQAHLRGSGAGGWVRIWPELDAPTDRIDATVPRGAPG